jgi:hypothetical protein
MNYIKQLRYGFLLTALFVCAGTASAQGPVNDAATTTSNLAVSATFVTALQLEIKTATSGATVGGPAGSYTLGFGDIDGLGLSTPGDNITRTAVSGGYMYTTPITLTPSFSGFAGTAAAAITVGQNASDGATSKAAAREGAEVDSVAVLPAVASARVVAATAASGTPFDRFIGVFVPTSNGGNAIAGDRAMNLVYTITIP